MKILLNNTFILLLIILNSIIIFINGFEIESLHWLNYADNLLTVVFGLEAYKKIKVFSFKEYLKDNWNVFDFIIVILSIPSLLIFLEWDYSWLLVLRTARVFKVFRFFKFIPNIDRLLRGIRNALRVSIVVFVAFFLYIFIVGILSHAFFSHSELFKDPLTSIYTTVKIFSIEGWYDFPDELIKGEVTNIKIFFIRFYFVIILLTGGVFGLSIVNSIFVNAMIDNEIIESKVNNLDKKVDEILKKLK